MKKLSLSTRRILKMVVFPYVDSTFPVVSGLFLLTGLPSAYAPLFLLLCPGGFLSGAWCGDTVMVECSALLPSFRECCAPPGRLLSSWGWSRSSWGLFWSSPGQVGAAFRGIVCPAFWGRPTWHPWGTPVCSWSLPMLGWPEGPRVASGLGIVLSSEVLVWASWGFTTREQGGVEAETRGDPGSPLFSGTLSQTQLPCLRIPFHLDLPPLCCGQTITWGKESSGPCRQVSSWSWGAGFVSGPAVFPMVCGWVTFVLWRVRPGLSSLTCLWQSLAQVLGRVSWGEGALIWRASS